jgi:hypothetical protein
MATHRKVASYQVPKFDEELKLNINGDTARNLLIQFSTRSGREFKRQLIGPIWEHHTLPMYRGNAVEEVPFELKVLRVTIDFAKASFTVVYKFVSA